MTTCPRSLECECCGQEVEIRGRQRYLDMVESGRRPLCEQCRRYVSTVTARVPESPGMMDVMTVVARRKIRLGAKRPRVLANLPIGRVNAAGFAGGRDNV